jgi:hypothetical protein
VTSREYTVSPSPLPAARWPSHATRSRRLMRTSVPAGSGTSAELTDPRRMRKNTRTFRDAR